MYWINIIYLILFFFGFFFVSIFLILHFRFQKKLFYSPPVTKGYSLSIVVPCYNEEKEIGETMKSLLNSDYKNLKKIIVVDDCSKDNSYEIIKKWADKNKKIIAVQTPKNTGCAAGAKNFGAKFVDTELIGFSDSDSFPEKEAVRKMIGYFDDEKVAAVTSRVPVKESKNFLQWAQILDYDIIAWTRKLLDFVDSVYVTNGPLSIYRKKIFDRLNGFNDKNLTEDIEITWNILSKGYKTRMSYDSLVPTKVPDKLKQWINQRVRWNVGGLQTLRSYWKFILFNPENSFGSFVIPYVASAFMFAIIGLLLFSRYVWIKGSYQFSSIFYFFKGYNYFDHIFEWQFSFTILLFFAFVFFIISLIYYKIGFSNSYSGKQNILNILTYTFIYRPLYTIPLVLALYRLAKGDIRWYTR